MQRTAGTTPAGAATCCSRRSWATPTPPTPQPCAHAHIFIHWITHNTTVRPHTMRIVYTIKYACIVLILPLCLHILQGEGEILARQQNTMRNYRYISHYVNLIRENSRNNLLYVVRRVAGFLEEWVKGFWKCPKAKEPQNPIIIVHVLGPRWQASLMIG